MSSLASLKDSERARLLEKLTPAQAEALRWDWSAWARPNQLAPSGDWRIWLLLAGRGFGKTRAGAEWVRDRVWRHGARRVLLIAKTPAEARDIMVEGDSGLLHIGPEPERPEWFPASRTLKWSNGCIGHVRSGAEPDGVRGLQGDTAWCDELAAWKYPQDTWDMVQFCMRLGSNPQTCVTTTPKPISLIRELLDMPGVTITRGSSYDNLDNLAHAFVQEIIARYEGTTLGQQEIYAAVLDEAEGALWKRETINQTRLNQAPDLQRIVVGVDPAITARSDSNETGVLVAGVDRKDHGYVLEDCSGRFMPNVWANRVVDAYERHGADRVVAEANQGGEMVRHTLQTVAPNLPIRLVHATKGKRTRAEPISALYEQEKVHHVGIFRTLEDQLCTWEPLSGDDSPDRLDALVWALTELMPVRTSAVAIDGVEGQNYWGQAG